VRLVVDASAVLPFVLAGGVLGPLEGHTHRAAGASHRRAKLFTGRIMASTPLGMEASISPMARAMSAARMSLVASLCR
jgi:hypothetical protein